MKGSAMGNAIGIVDDGHPEDATEAAKFDRPMADGEDGAEKHFGELLRAKNVARSDFSRSKSMLQQRQALPIHACKDAILRAVRENSVVVVEGETGSGKTTQLVPFNTQCQSVAPRSTADSGAGAVHARGGVHQAGQDWMHAGAR